MLEETKTQVHEIFDEESPQTDTIIKVTDVLPINQYVALKAILNESDGDLDG